MGIFSIGLSALNAAQAGLMTASHNIANAATAGYHRQQTVQVSSIGQLTGAGFIGQGVQVSTVRRVYSEFLTHQLAQAQAQASQLDAYYAQIRQLDNLLGDTFAGLSPALQSFFAAVDEVAANPASVPSRQTLISTGQTLAARFRSLDQRISEIRQGIDSQIASSVARLNSLAQQVARLNEAIVMAQGTAGGRPPNDLLDQRDALVTEINTEIGATVVEQSDGAYNIIIGNGQTLVMGTQAHTLTAAVSPADPTRTVVGYVAGGRTVQIPETSLQGGALSGYLAFRSDTLDPAQNALGRIAVALAQTFNDQHRLGQDLNGAIGSNFFAEPGPGIIPHAANAAASTITAAIVSVDALTAADYRFAFDGANYTLTRLTDGTTVSMTTAPSGASPLTLDGVSVTATSLNAGESFLIQPSRNGARDFAVVLSDPGKVAAAVPIRTAASASNTGSGRISPGSVNPPPPANADLQQPVTITFHTPYDGRFDVTGSGTGLPALNQVYSDGADISFNGWTVQLSGSPAAGDTFTISPNVNGTADNRNALLLAGLRTRNTLAGGTATYQGAYAQLVASIGNKTRELEVMSEAQANLVAQAEQAQQALSGVNLDEEAANLLRYQQAYQAAGRVMQIASRLFDTVLELGN